MDLYITGTVLEVHPIQDFGNFWKRSVWLETGDEGFEQILDVEFHKEKSELLDDINPDDDIRIDINLRGRKWVPNDDRPPRVFNSLVGWRIEKLQSGAMKHADSGQEPAYSAAPAPQTTPEEPQPEQAATPPKDDIPF